VCRPLAQLNEILSSDNQLYATFYQNVQANSRLPQDNEWDRIRQAVDALLFPYYYEDIRFGALSLDGSGVSGYGDYCISLRQAAIRERASVFEENTILFIKKRRIVAGDVLPLGYRASWKNRAMLAAAKLGGRLNPATTSDEYQALLIPLSARDADFIEVHIFGPIHRLAIKHLSGPQPRKKADKLILRSIIRKLNEIGATSSIT
jgi:hypothetical protein